MLIINVFGDSASVLTRIGKRTAIYLPHHLCSNPAPEANSERLRSLEQRAPIIGKGNAATARVTHSTPGRSIALEIAALVSFHCRALNQHFNGQARILSWGWMNLSCRWMNSASGPLSTTKKPRLLSTNMVASLVSRIEGVHPHIPSWFRAACSLRRQREWCLSD